MHRLSLHHTVGTIRPYRTWAWGRLQHLHQAQPSAISPSKTQLPKDVMVELNVAGVVAVHLLERATSVVTLSRFRRRRKRQSLHNKNGRRQDFSFQSRELLAPVLPLRIGRSVQPHLTTKAVKASWHRHSKV